MSVYRDPRSPFYWYDFQYKGRRFFGSTKRTSKREAEIVERQEREHAKREMAALRVGMPLTMDYACGREWEESGKHAETADDIWRSLQWLSDYFGKDTMLDAIANDDAVAGAVARRRGELSKNSGKPVSNATVNRTVTEPLKRLLKRARLEHNVNWRRHRLPEPDERVRELVGDESDRLEAATRDDYQPFFRFLLASGLRRNEALYLRWSQVHWQQGQIVIEKRNGGKGKGGKTVRRKLTPTIQNILRPLIGHHHDRVFTYIAKSTRGGRVRGKRYAMTEQGVKSAWRRIIGRSGVTDLRLHDLRHDFGTKLLRATRNLKLVKEAMTHSDISITARYAHVLDEEIGAGMEAMEEQRERDKESRNKSRTPLPKVV